MIDYVRALILLIGVNSIHVIQIVITEPTMYNIDILQIIACYVWMSKTLLYLAISWLSITQLSITRCLKLMFAYRLLWSSVTFYILQLGLMETISNLIRICQVSQVSQRDRCQLMIVSVLVDLIVVCWTVRKEYSTRFDQINFSCDIVSC